MGAEHPVRNAIISGLSMAAALYLFVVISLFFVTTQQEKMAGAIVCGLGAPAVQVETPNGTTYTIRDEGFINSVCLIPLDFTPADSNGDGIIDMTPDTP